MSCAFIKSIASFVPENCVGNEFFTKFLDTDDEWIVQRTGIKTRYFANKSQKSSDLGLSAAKSAMQRANIGLEDIDLVLCATLSPDFFGMPSTACIIAAKLGIVNTPAFDITAACTGFIHLLSVAKGYIESGMYKNILLVCAEKCSDVLDFSDRGTCILFGDGAAACVISNFGESKPTISSKDSNKNDVKIGIKDVHISSNGEYADLLYTPRHYFEDSNLGILEPDCDLKSNSSEISNSQKTEQKMIMKGNEVFKVAVRTISNEAKSILQKNGLTIEDIDFFIPHQANIRIIDSVSNALNFPRKKLILTVQKYGNTSAASIPMAICDGVSEGKIRRGDLLLLDSFGSGFTWGSALVYADFV